MSTLCPDNLIPHDLGDNCQLWTGTLPQNLTWNSGQFDQAWQLRPSQRHTVVMYGKEIELPRDQQAYGFDYAYTGSVNNALPIPDLLQPLLHYAKTTIFEPLNGLLLNWYHNADYIGPHHDSTRGLVKGSPIVTFSFGEDRCFRMSQAGGREPKKVDFLATHGSILVIPWNTNKAWKHAVPRRAKYKDRRISVTIRAFQ